MREGSVGFKSFVERKSTIMMVGQRFRSRIKDSMTQEDRTKERKYGG